MATENELILLLGDFNMFIQRINLKTKQIIQSANSHLNQLKQNPKCTIQEASQNVDSLIKCLDNEFAFALDVLSKGPELKSKLFEVKDMVTDDLLS